MNLIRLDLIIIIFNIIILFLFYELSAQFFVFFVLFCLLLFILIWIILFFIFFVFFIEKFIFLN